MKPEGEKGRNRAEERRGIQKEKRSVLLSHQRSGEGDTLAVFPSSKGVRSRDASLVNLHSRARDSL